MTRILVLGASGMLGNAMLRYFATRADYDVRGTVRSKKSADVFSEYLRDRLIANVDANDIDSVLGAVADFQPTIIINCIGLIKQLASGGDPLAAIPVNALMPHRLARVAAAAQARFVHISTDCVFTGSRGDYRESDIPDANDLYGRSKLLGEVDAPNSITLRTSIIGHELASAHGLVDWFLGQRVEVKGYARAIFSGLPTVELARVIADCVLPFPELRGLYHVSAAPISKLDLLRLVGTVYNVPTSILPDSDLVIDRSLNSDRFRNASGYTPPSWPDLVAKMRDFG
jgi:dTDP-4-dehydrorhamnose reductase